MAIMKMTLAAAIGCMAALSAQAETYAFRTKDYWGGQPAGDVLHFSDTNNWNWIDKGLPTSSLTDTNIRLFMYGRTAVNDWDDDYLLRDVEFTQLGPTNLMTGNALNLGLGGIVMFGSSTFEPGTTIATQRIENVVRAAAASNNPVLVAVKPEHVLEFYGLLTTYGDDATDKHFSFNNTGVVVLRGGMYIDKETGDYRRQTFQSTGDFIIESDVYVPSIEAKGGAHIVIRNGAKVETWSAYNSFYQQCTVDIEDGYLLNHGLCCTAQDSAMSGASVFNVKSKGVLDTGVKGMRLANNAPAEINIYDGGVMWLRNNNSWALCEGGRTDFNLYGGEVRCGNEHYGNGQFPLSINKGSETKYNTTPCTVNLAGGEMRFIGFADYTAKGIGHVPTYIYLDGVTFRLNASVETFFYFSTSATTANNPSRVKVYMREGGCTLDTREFNVTWNAVELKGSDLDGGRDGDFVKLGSGKLTVSAPFSFTGATVVKNGTLHVGDADYLTGAVDLRPAATLSFTGTTLSLASLASKGGIVKLASGQSLALGEAPAIDGLLVFDVTVADGTRTLLTAPGLTADMAALCAVKSPVAGKSCTFSVEGDSLVLTVASGTAPAAPAYPDSEDAELNKAGNTSVDFGETVERIGGNGPFRYVGAGEKTFGAGDIRLTGNMSLSLASGAGDLTMTGAPDKVVASTTAAALTMSTAWNNMIRLSGEWAWGWPYSAFTVPIATDAGNFMYGPGLEPEDAFASLNFKADSSHTVYRSTLALEASSTAAKDPMQPGERSAFILDGGTVKVAGAGAGSLSDFLRGATAFAIGEGGGTIDTCGHDVTITQTLLPTGAVSGTFAKAGEGTLTLAGRENAIFGALAVSNGTLVASFDTSLRRPYPEGALAIWTFDGENPYTDKTGHGYDLLQAHPDVAEVEFTDENGMSGKAARWSSSVRGGALYVSPESIKKTDYAQYRQTISAWVRYTGTLTTYATILSTRTKVNFGSGAGNSFDLSYKGLGSAVGGGYGFSTVWNGGMAAIPNNVVGHAPALDTWHHLVMVADNYSYRSYLDGVRYRDQTNGGFSGQFLPDGYMITLGQDHVDASGVDAEMMALGGMVDEVAVYPRRLTEVEIQSLYTAQAQSGAFDLTVAGGATWNMNASTSTVKSVTGTGTVSNGKIVVTGRIVTDPAAAGAMAVDALSFGEGGVIDLGYGEDERRAVGRRTLIGFAELDAAGRAAVKGWSFANAGTDRKSKVSLVVGEGALYLDVTPVGTAFIIR